MIFRMVGYFILSFVGWLVVWDTCFVNLKMGFGL